MNWFLLIIFGILPFVGALFAFRTWHLLRYGERVTGTITSYERVRGTEHRKTFYMPTVGICDSNGNAHTITMRMSETPDRSGKHESLTVIYPKGKPETARLKRFASLWLIPLFLCGPAIVLGTIFGGHLLWFPISFATLVLFVWRRYAGNARRTPG